MSAADDLSRRRFRLFALGLSIAAALVVFLVASEAFPYHSTNHDEGVYLQQAAMLLDGKLYLRPPVEGAMRPWFFVDAESPVGPARAVPAVDGDVVYSKYSPVPAGMFALGLALGVPRLSLALVGAGIVALTACVTSEVFDRRRGVVAAALVLASPLFVVDTATFLPYAPTTLLNLAFAWAYLRANRPASTRRHARRWALGAGLAIGAAFFARPFTALLFALPFVVHAAWTLAVAHKGEAFTATLVRQGLVAVGGLVGVAAALGYNWALTGDPLVFPYLAFAPRDGLGFGRRAILGYERDYDLSLAVAANARVLASLFGRWVVAGPLGSLLALAGVFAALGQSTREVRPLLSTDDRRLLLAGLFVSVPLGNLVFWGNLNLLGDLSTAGDGLIAFLGPYYHFDLLLPVAAFAGHALVLGVGGLRAVTTIQFSTRDAGRVVSAGLVVGTVVFGGVAVAAVAEPVAENAAVSDQLSVAYEPVVETEFDHAVVFLPTPFGDWLNHPFQALRNDPGFGNGPEAAAADHDGEEQDDVVYALRARQFAVVDAYPNRALYRYTYRGGWAPFLGKSVQPHLQRIDHVEGDRVVLDGTVGVPRGADGVSVRLTADGETAYHASNVTHGALPFSLVLTDGSARLTGPFDGDTRVPISGRTDVELTVFVDFGAGQAFSYEFTLPVLAGDGGVRALSPYVEVCRDQRLCGGEAAYVPGSHHEGIFVETTLRASLVGG